MPTSEVNISNESIVISCRNSQGTKLAATVLRLKRYSVVFEVYNPYSILQTSEVLRDFKITMDKRVVYVGNATVTNIMNTGVFLICEVTLEEAWLDVFVSSSNAPQDLKSQLSGFLADWGKANEVITPVKLVTFETESLFVGLRQWLEKVDLGIRSTATTDRKDLEKEIFLSLESQVEEMFHPLVLRFCEVAREVPDLEIATHKAFVRRQLHPLVLCAPFLYRTYTKPLGYAGDFEMVNMMLNQEFSGGSAFAKLINYTFLKSPPAEAHRNRIDILEEKIRTLAEKAVRGGRRLKIFNLGCGPAEEIYRFILNEDLADEVDVTLLDFNEDTLRQTEERLTRARQEAGRSIQIKYVQKSVNQVLREVSKGESGDDRYDLVYCAGLFDYLSQKVCNKLVSTFFLMTNQGGQVLVTNVSTDNPVSEWMEYVMEWNLIYRNDQDMLKMSEGIPEGGRAEVYRDETGVNTFLELHH